MAAVRHRTWARHSFFEGFICKRAAISKEAARRPKNRRFFHASLAVASSFYRLTWCHCTLYESGISFHAHRRRARSLDDGSRRWRQKGITQTATAATTNDIVSDGGLAARRTVCRPRLESWVVYFLRPPSTTPDRIVPQSAAQRFPLTSAMSVSGVHY